MGDLTVSALCECGCQKKDSNKKKRRYCFECSGLITGEFALVEIGRSKQERCTKCKKEHIKYNGPKSQSTFPMGSY